MYQQAVSPYINQEPSSPVKYPSPVTNYSVNSAYPAGTIAAIRRSLTQPQPQPNAQHPTAPDSRPASLHPKPSKAHPQQYHGLPADHNDADDKACCDFRLSNDQKEVVTWIVSMQIPLVIANLVLSLFSPTSDCMDKPIPSFRSCLFYTFFIDAILVGLALAAYLLSSLSVITEKCETSVINMTMVASTIKTLLWAAMQTYLFHSHISPTCSGGIYAYEMFTVILHGFYLIVGGVFLLLLLYMQCGRHH